ncbi:alpha/beta fold hydrolase [Sphingobium boeckii]|uniref:Pimeloyl-ACP methyl ester carboxylesterase n=1 Tax=Sphingobium boeckii TaxID=1082345 RepID=A0A7W9AF98_9SPHN|nr:alpha/beta hydrolase [Sphingobium boeckii]MBB5684477.1 pimeloyl-ACP methyl ester carboxylesterase [Sphingobium boeckii]
MTEFALKRVALSTGVELDVAEEGPRDAPVLIFLHGFPESHRTWRHQIRHFSDRFRCIAPDQRGYCKSSKPEPVSDYSPDKLAADIFALADALGVERFTVVGHDWGGAIAWIVALMGQANGRVERAIIANAPHPYLFQRLLIENDEQRAASQYMRAFRDPANDALIRDHGLAALLMKAIKWDRSSAMTAEDSAILLRDWQEPGAAFGMLNWYRASTIQVPAIGEQAERPAMLDSVFPTITIPTLVIWATDDKALPLCNLDGMAEMVSDLRIVKVPDCGHFVPWEAPDAVNAAMDGFL